MKSILFALLFLIALVLQLIFNIDISLEIIKSILIAGVSLIGINSISNYFEILNECITFKKEKLKFIDLFSRITVNMEKYFAIRMNGIVHNNLYQYFPNSLNSIEDFEKLNKYLIKYINANRT